MSEAVQRITADEYLARERAAELKSELIDGEVVMMSGSSRAHGLIAMNVAVGIAKHLHGKPCEAYGSDVRVQAAGSRSYFYPDLSVACGEIEFTADYPDTLLNPSVIVEVLSPSTEHRDRGPKWWQYQLIPSLRHYVLVAQDQCMVELFSRRDDQWVYERFDEPEATVELTAIGCRLRLAEVYAQVQFVPAEPTPDDAREP